jgi:hypothetical protein
MSMTFAGTVALFLHVNDTRLMVHITSRGCIGQKVNHDNVKYVSTARGPKVGGSNCEAIQRKNAPKSESSLDA